MKKTTIMGMALAALFAISAMTAVSASAALPEFKTTTFPVTFISKNKPGLEPTLNGKVLGVPVAVTCKTSATSGEVASATLAAKILITYTECKVGTAVCTTSGLSAGEIMTNRLKAKPGYLNKTTKTVGLELRPMTGTIFAKFTCTGLPVGEVSGCLMGQWTPVNVLQATALVTYLDGGTTTQEFTKFEGGPECTLSTFGEKSALMNISEVTFAKAVELTA